MKILIINPGGIGDQILLLPTIELLKAKFPTCEIDLLTEPRGSIIGELTNLYRKIKTFDFKEKKPNIFKLREILRSQPYKYIISAGSSYKANFITSLGDAEIKIGFYSGIFSNLFLSYAVKLNTKQYTANMLAELITPIIPELRDTIQKKDLIPEIKLLLSSVEWAKETLKPRIKDRYYARKIFIHPGVSKLSKEKNILKFWSSKYWAKLIEKLLENKDNTVILIGGKDDVEAISEIHKNLTFFTRPQNFIDFSSLKLNLQELASLIASSDLLVCVDSAPMHISVALGKRLVAFFGPTDPKKLLPNDPRFLPVHVDNLKCRPCLFDSRKESCSKPECLQVKPENMFDAINHQLSISAKVN